MITLIGIFVITSSACYQPTHEFIRASTSSTVAHNEIARPVCNWISHQWIEKIDWLKEGRFKIIQQCVYCERKRIKKEVWEDVK